MSNYTEIHGIIEVPLYQEWEGAERCNAAALSALPATDTWPYLVQSMFSMTPQQFSYVYQLIHFGASMKGIEEAWLEWLDKFESLLRTMQWSTVTLHLSTEYAGNHTFTWIADNSGRVQPISSWTYEGNPRNVGVNESRLNSEKEEY